MRHPVDPNSYDYTDPFGSMLGRSYPHTGSDYAVGYAEVYSVAEAVVVHTGWSDGNGNYVTCYLPGRDWDGVEGGCYIAYLHLSSINTQVDARLQPGEKLAVSGNSGSNSRGPHLHITMSNSDLAHLGIGAKVDPWQYIQDRLSIDKPKPQPAPVATRAQVIARLQKYIADAKKKLREEQRKGKKADVKKIAKYREQIARNETRLKNYRRSGK
jgi:murein DD-endopeptidase MepM/ murein hydrolase activator NlpD